MNWLHRDAAGSCLAPRGSAVCIGAFDGVHRGHQAVLAKVRERAQIADLEPIAISFAPLPRVYFARGPVVPQISSVREKIVALRDAGMSRVLLLRFDARLAATSAADFIARVLVKRIGAREVWVGESFRFGNGREGDLAMLRREGAAYGLRAAAIEAVVIDGERVSSSRIRALLAEGDFDVAANMLGRRFAIGGHVVRGAQLGRKLGYPTANVRPGSRTVPIGGVFAVRVTGIHAQPMPGVASLGRRPTVDGRDVLLEAHLFDFDGDLYGKCIEVEFVQKLRDEEKFDSLDAMVRQIDLDVRAARGILSRSTTATAGVLT